MSWRRVMAWLVAPVVGLGLVGLGVYFVHLGLDRANQLAGVIGAFTGLVGLGLAAYGIVLARRAPASRPADAPAQVDQTVSSSSIGGDNIQIGGARDVDIHRGGR